MLSAKEARSKRMRKGEGQGSPSAGLSKGRPRSIDYTDDEQL